MPTAAELYQVIDHLGLVAPAHRAEWARLSADRAVNPTDVISGLLRREWITPFQARHLTENKADSLRLGQYILIDHIGEGGMGQVYKARNRDFDEVVCLKVIRQELTGSNKLVRRFDRERQVVTQLSHPNIVAAYDSGEEGAILFYAMEFVDGVDLGRLVQERGALPLREACEYIRQAALGLQHAHEAGLIHRDVKPDNFLLEHKTGRVKLLDLGLVRIEPTADDSGGTALTVRGTAIGTPEYMAPEQIRDSTSVDPRADVYSLGCTFYYLLTGQDPFRGRTPTEVMYQQVTKDPTPAEQIRPEVPAALASLLRRLMKKKREERIQTAAEVSDRLGKLLQADPKTWHTLPAEDQPRMSAPPRPLNEPRTRESGPSPTDSLRPIVTPAPRPRQIRSSMGEYIALGLAVLILVGLAAWWVWIVRR